MSFHYSLCAFVPMLATLLLIYSGIRKYRSISEALHILHSWNPEWNPKLWMCDYSDAEISALECCFPDAIVYLCDFHREQAWEKVGQRWETWPDIRGSGPTPGWAAGLCMGTTRKRGWRYWHLLQRISTAPQTFKVVGRSPMCSAVVINNMALHIIGTYMMCMYVAGFLN